MNSCRNLVIGCGEAGKYLAWNLAKLGQKTVVVERALLGGSCPNIACLPSKNVIHSAKAIALVDPVKGLQVTTGAVHVDMAGVVHRKQKMIDELHRIHLANFKTSGAELIMGDAKFLEPKTVQVTRSCGEQEILTGERVFLNLGSRATIPDVPGLADARPKTHVEALDLERLPRHLVVLGGGYIGLEFAQAIRRFGSEVTIIQYGSQLLTHADPDVAAAVLALMQEEGIKVLLQTELTKVAGHSGSQVTLHLRSGSTDSTLDASDILVATGRTPNTDRIDLEKAGVQLDARKFICVTETLKTTAPDTWAMGDCAGSPQFTHASFDDFRVVFANLDGQHRTTSNRLIPSCLFIDPELAHIGLTEREARAKNILYRLSTLPMSKVLRSQTLSQTRGFIKALISNDDRILGFTAFGIEASEMLAVIQTAMVANIPYTQLRDTIFTHPTAAEGLVFLFANPPSAPLEQE